MRIFIDVTRTAGAGFHTGIQKVVRGLVRGLSAEAAERGFVVVPVILTMRGAHALPSLPSHPLEADQAEAAAEEPPRPARGSSPGWSNLRSLLQRARMTFLARERGGVLARTARAGVRSGFTALRVARAAWRSASLEPVVAFRAGDVLLMPDSSWQIEPWQAIRQVKRAGGRVVAVVYDIIPLQRPDCFDPGLVEPFRAYLEGLLREADELVCISRTVRDEVGRYAASRDLPAPALNWLWPGAALTRASAEPPARLIDAMRSSAILIVATIEPRKGHDLLLDAAEILWAQGLDHHLVIVGSIGWHVTALVARMGQHPEWERRLHVFHDLRDGDVTYALQHARVLAFPSSAEGFGLPIVEAELAGCPVVCSDIPVFREIAPEHAVLFSPHDADSLAAALRPFVEGDGGRPEARVAKAPREGLGPDDYARRFVDLLAGRLDPDRPSAA